MCYSLWYNTSTMLPAGHRPATSWVHYTTSCYTQSSAPEDGKNKCPKYVELIGIINILLLLHIVGCLCNLHCYMFRLEFWTLSGQYITQNFFLFSVLYTDLKMTKFPIETRNYAIELIRTNK